MYTVGQQLVGFTYDRSGDRIKVSGSYVATTDDPEEYIQDVILNVDGKIVYCDEQDIYLPEHFPADYIEGTSLDVSVQAEDDFDQGDLDAIVEAYDVRQA
jgi:hypothetical protein